MEVYNLIPRAMIDPNLQVTVAVALDEIENNSLPNKLKLKYDSHSYNNGENMLAMAAKHASMLSYSFIITSSFGVDLVRVLLYTEEFMLGMRNRGHDKMHTYTETNACKYSNTNTYTNTHTNKQTSSLPPA